MRFFTKNTLGSLFFIFTVIFASSLFAECKVTILHFNDLHGFMRVPGKGLGGAERLAALVAKIDTENAKAGRHTLLLFGGDLISGTPVSEKFNGEAEFTFLNAIKTEAMVIGNHDFDFGIPALEKNMKRADFPILAANIIDRQNERLFTNATYVFPLEKDCRVGIIGLTLQNTPEMTGKDVSSLKFEDPVKTTSYYIGDMVEQSEIKVALAHIADATDNRLAKSIPEIDIIISGHDHPQAQGYCHSVNGTPICETPAKGRYLGRVDLSVNNGKVVVENKELIPVGKKSGKDRGIRKLLAPYFSAVDKDMATVVTKLSATLYYRPRTNTPKAEELGSVIADAMREQSKADVAMMNPGGLRKDINKGKVTKDDVFKALPFQNYVGVVELSGSELAEVVAWSEKSFNRSKYTKPLYWSGLEYKNQNGKLVIKVNGKPINDKDRYKLATVEFIAKGGDGYKMLAHKKFSSIGKLYRDVMITYLEKN